jgi:hypothetical protein
MQWQKHKMNVSVVAQTLSCSVASAITFLRENNVAEFHDSSATTEFILLMNNVFDILNSKSKFGRRSKAPISLENYSEVCKYLTEGNVQSVLQHCFYLQMKLAIKHNQSR